MDAKQAAALRKPFDPKSVGKLPKGGTMLDYVGHASVTDRLLAVDPDWNWEPFAYDMSGLPMLDASRNLWIKLTVCGVTRIGVGDGKSLKECIGDAIRNAAMRFGVALDLWSKEELEGADGPVFKATAEPVAPQATRTMSRKPVAAPDEPDVLSPAQLTKLHVCFGEAEPKMGRDEALKWLSTITGREVTSSKTLTRDEANKAINILEADRQQAAS